MKTVKLYSQMTEEEIFVELESLLDRVQAEAMTIMEANREEKVIYNYPISSEYLMKTSEVNYETMGRYTSNSSNSISRNLWDTRVNTKLF